MINYEFLCEKCGYKDEIYLPISKRNVKRNCPKCLNILTRLIGNSTGFFLKGDGFYKSGWGGIRGE